ncbi:MAG: hypothetical protein Q9160_004583 [Pyrenula sp. 1 TL-2023]
MTDVQTLPIAQQSATPTTTLRKRSFDEASLSSDQPTLYTINDQLQSIEAPAAFPTPESGPTTGGMSRQSSPALSTLSNTPSIPQLDGTASITKPNVPKKRKIDDIGAVKTDQPHDTQPTKGKPAKKKLSEEEEKARMEKQRLKEEERARKQAAKEAREEKKRQVEEKKAKAAKAQPKLKNFFTISSNLAAQSHSPSPNQSRRPSVTSVEGIDAASSPSHQNDLSEYEKTFLPFCVQSNVRLAKSPFEKSPEWLRNSLQQIDEALGSNGDKLDAEYQAPTNRDFLELLDLPFKQRRGIKPSKTIREIMSGGSRVSDPIDLTSENGLEEHYSKFLSYHEDIRPPYIGTFTKPISPPTTRKLARNPCRRGLPDTNYDYDSEAEWEPPQEGDEDLGSDDDDDEASDEEDDMDGFLDDENDHLQRQKVVGDMQPISSGLCWGYDGQTDSAPFDMNSMRAELLLENHSFPIDPFSTKYWPSTSQRNALQAPTTRAMQPPRAPLQTLSANTTSPNPLSTSKVEAAKALNGARRGQDPNKSLKLVSTEILPEFKAQIVDKTRTKIAMIEDLKERYVIATF